MDKKDRFVDCPMCESSIHWDFISDSEIDDESLSLVARINLTPKQMKNSGNVFNSGWPTITANVQICENCGFILMRRV